MTTIFEELTQVSKIKTKDGEVYDDFASRLFHKIAKLCDRDEEVWASLSEDAKLWYNLTGPAIHEKRELPPLTGYEAPDPRPHPAPEEPLAHRRNHRELDEIADDIRATAETTADILAIGGYLIEAKEQLDFGDWLPWLAREFDFSERTARNYMKAAEFAANRKTISDLRLTATALYVLAEDSERNTPEAIELVLQEAAAGRVTAARVDDILDTEWKRTRAQEREDLSQEVNAEQAILDGEAPPTAPPSELPAEPPTRAALQLAAFDTAIAQLKGAISTKRVATFTNTVHSVNDLQIVADFLMHIVRTKEKAAE
jgi:hypothetical protein